MSKQVSSSKKGISLNINNGKFNNHISPGRSDKKPRMSIIGSSTKHIANLTLDSSRSGKKKKSKEPGSGKNGGKSSFVKKK